METTWLRHKELIHAIYKYANAYASICYNETLGGEVKLSSIEVQIIEQILDHSDEHRNMKWYADKIGISTSTFTKNVNRMNKRGLVNKYHTSNNRKNVILVVTKEGILSYREYAEKAEKMIFGKIFDLLDHFSQEDLDRLQEVFDIMSMAHFDDVLSHPTLIKI